MAAIQAHRGPVLSALLTQNVLYTGGHDGLLKSWNLQTLSPIVSLDVGQMQGTMPSSTVALTSLRIHSNMLYQPGLCEPRREKTAHEAAFVVPHQPAGSRVQEVRFTAQHRVAEAAVKGARKLVRRLLPATTVSD